jgi:2-iminoacetate synthase
MTSKHFIDEPCIWDTIAANADPTPARIDEILVKALEGKGLESADVAALLAPMPQEQEQKLFDAAFTLKEKIYGNRIVLFAPLYITNECENRCAYCAFSAGNADLKRRSLTHDELAQEVRILQDMGHKRVLAVYGENPEWDAGAIADSVAAIHAVKQHPGAEIRRTNVNCAPLDIDGFRRLKEVGIGTYQCFQETYHRETYAGLHPGGRKKDYDWRAWAMHRAQEAGVDDVGLGVLFGLFDYRFEVLALLAHAESLEKNYGVGPHTISVPRIEPAQGSELSRNPPHAISNQAFKRVVALLRLAMPYTGMIITTRENMALKRELLRLGISQMSAGSRTYPGAYADALINQPEAQQFWVGDERSLPEIIRDLQNMGFTPSFCTACYRLGRTGGEFMNLAKTAFIHTSCEPNALTSYAEYLADYATPELRETGRRFIDAQTATIQEEGRRAAVQKRLAAIDAGKRDLYV